MAVLPLRCLGPSGELLIGGVLSKDPYETSRHTVLAEACKRSKPFVNPPLT